MRDQVSEAGGGHQVGVGVVEVHDHDGGGGDEGEGGDGGEEGGEAVGGEGGDYVAVGLGGLVVGGFDLGGGGVSLYSCESMRDRECRAPDGDY